MKSAAPHKQGTDASLEQVIKRSKKGAKIQVGIVNIIKIGYITELKYV